ncbi:MAG: bifunctional riboflavin kinase/FAD synthetase [Chitinophagales bacterium]
MKVHKSLDHLPKFKNAVITIGTFDGVHRGHREIIRNIVKSAQTVNGESVIITFHPHPRRVISPEVPVLHLHTIDEKLWHLQQLGVDHVVVVPFSREFSEMDAEEYVHTFLIGRFKPKIIVFGYDHRYGKNRRGDITLLKSIAALDNIIVHEIGAQTIADITISSTKIRHHLLEGNIATANTLLGYSYHLSGIVVRGDQIGRELGYPTANMEIADSEKLIPAKGVYAITAQMNKEEKKWYGMMSIGNRPTFEGTSQTIEAHLFQFNRVIYGEHITVSLIELIRREEKFASRSALIAAMDADKIYCEKLFGIRLSE